MRRVHVVITIIVLSLLVAAGGILFYFFNVDDNDDSWLNASGDDEEFEEMIFGDVSESHVASEYILSVTTRNIMFASGDGNFYPDNLVTVEEFLEILTRASMPRLNFNNLSGDDFSRLLSQNKVIDENEMTKEKLNSSVTNYDATILLAKADLKIRNSTQLLKDIKYTDLENIDEIGRTLVSHAYGRGFVVSKNQAMFYPNKNLTRAELAKLIYLFVNS